MHRLLVVVLLFTIACAYHPPDAPTPIAPVTNAAPFSLNVGSVVGTGSSAGATTLTARVQNGGGAVMPGVMVQFATDVGTLSAASVMTAGNGEAISTLTSAGGSTSAVTVTAGTLSTRLVVTTPTAVVAPPTPPPPVPLPDPTLPTPPLTVQLLVTPRQAGTATDFSLITQPIRSATWTFGDASTPVTTSEPFISHVYIGGGYFPAGVTVTDMIGRTASGSALITVPAAPTPPPTVNVSSYTVTLSASPTSVAVGGSATLTAVATALNGAPTPTLYTWDCDNNATIDFTSSTPSASCTYPTVGNVTGKVTVTGGSATGAATTTVTVTAVPTVPPALVPSYIVTLAASPTSVVVGQASTLTATVTAVNGAPAPTLYAWDCDNSVSSIDFTTPTPSTSCTYLATGNITGKVVVTGGSATGSATTTVTVTP